MASETTVSVARTARCTERSERKKNSDHAGTPVHVLARKVVFFFFPLPPSRNYSPSLHSLK